MTASRDPPNGIMFPVNPQAGLVGKASIVVGPTVGLRPTRLAQKSNMSPVSITPQTADFHPIMV